MASWQGHGTVPFRWTTWGDSLTSSGEILVAAEGRDPLGVLLEVAGNRLEAMVVMVEGWLKIRDLVVNYYSDSWVGWFTILIVEHSWVIYYSDLCLQKFALDFGWRTWFGQKGCNKMDSTLTWTAWTQSVTQTSNLIPAHAGTCCHISSHGQMRYGPSYRKGKGVYMFGWEPMGTLRWSEMSPRGKALLGEFTPWFSLKPCKTWFSPRCLFLKFETKINRTFPTFRSSPPKKDMFFFHQTVGLCSCWPRRPRSWCHRDFLPRQQLAVRDSIPRGRPWKPETHGVPLKRCDESSGVLETNACSRVTLSKSLGLDLVCCNKSSYFLWILLYDFTIFYMGFLWKIDTGYPRLHPKVQSITYFFTMKIGNLSCLEPAAFPLKNVEDLRWIMVHN